MQFPYPTAALTAIPLRTSSPTPVVPTIPLLTTYLPLLTTYLSLRITIVPPAVPIRSACHTLHSTYCANHPAERTDRASIHHIRTAARTDPASCSDNCATARTDHTSIHPIRSAERTDPACHFDISTIAHTNHPRRCASHSAAHIIPHACSAHHPATHLFNLVSALYFH